jgi:hypothetical protein
MKIYQSIDLQNIINVGRYNANTNSVMGYIIIEWQCFVVDGRNISAMFTAKSANAVVTDGLERRKYWWCVSVILLILHI